MNSNQFVVNYVSFLDEVEKVVKPDLVWFIKNLKKINPHHLVPDTPLQTEPFAKGTGWEMFGNKVLNNSYIPFSLS
jgi:hypothetical protein